MGLILDFSWFLVLVACIALVCEFMDSSLGMGYGTTLTPILLLMGFEAAQIVPAVLISEFITGLLSAAFHALFKNMSLGKTKKPAPKIPGTRTITDSNASQELVASGGGYPTKENTSLVMKFNELTIDTKVVIVLTLFGIVGTLIAAITSALLGYNPIFKFAVKVYIGVMVFLMGVLILSLRKKQIKFSFTRIVFIGSIAGFNKGLSGGGYGPLTVSGQILSGREGKNAIASTSLSEGIICFVGASAYILTNVISSHVSGGPITVGELGLTPYLLIGAVISAPLAALTTKSIDGRWLKLLVGIATILLGLFSLTRTILHYVGIW